MSNFRILTDSVSDLSEEWLKAHPNVTVIDTPIILANPDGGEQIVLRGQTADNFKDIERKYLKKGYKATTSTPNLYEVSPESELDIPSVEGVTKRALYCGKSVIYLAMDSELSSTYDFVSTLYDQLREQYTLAPDQQLICIDTGCMSTGLGLATMQVAAHLEEDFVLDLEQEALQICEQVTHIFSLNDFTQIKASGKMPTAKATFAQLLHINPFMGLMRTHADSTKGRELLSIYNRIRKEDELIQLMAEFIKQTIAQPNSTIIAAHGNCPKRGKKLAAAIRELLPEAEILSGDDWRIGPSVQVHVGVTTIAAYYLADHDINAEEAEIIIQEILRSRNK